MQQYPHFLFIKTQIDSVQDSQGNWSPVTERWVFVSECREQTNGKGSLINKQDGIAIVFASVVHLPLGTERIKEGAEVLVSETNSETGTIRIQKQVLKYDVGQLHNRLWL